MVSFTHEHNIIYSQTIVSTLIATNYGQTQLDDIAHEPTIVCRSRGGLSANEKEEQFASNDNKSYSSFFSVCETAQRGSCCSCTYAANHSKSTHR